MKSHDQEMSWANCKTSEARRPRIDEKLKYFISSLQVLLVPLMLILKLPYQHCHSKMLLPTLYC